MSSFKISDVLSESWEKLPGAKWPIWSIMLSGLFAILLSSVVMAAIGIKLYSTHLPLIWDSLITPIVLNVIMGIFICGILMPAIKKCRGEAIQPTTGFEYFNRAPQAMTLMLITGGLNAILMYLSEVLNKNFGMAPTHFSLIQLGVSVISLLIMVLFYLSIPLIADKNQTVFQAMANSIRYISRRWHKVLAIILLLYIFTIVAAIPLLVGILFHHPLISLLGGAILITALVWLLPYWIMVQTNVYLKLASPQQGS